MQVNAEYFAVGSCLLPKMGYYKRNDYKQRSAAMAGQNISHEGHRQRMRAACGAVRAGKSGTPRGAGISALHHQRPPGYQRHRPRRCWSGSAALPVCWKPVKKNSDRVPGVGPASARMLHLLPEVSRYYEHSRTSTEGALTTTERLAAYLKPRFAGAKQEKALLLSLDSRSRVKSVYWLKEGNRRTG